ncbi:methyltransferase domain-containing protein [Fodinicurvata sediminis]|uniref:methyltransferase domain-containing protein n=1 Tax=Fodinicurvata sediminis TaxID=1121832 RepID=UPI0003B765A5|nr:methyltransferase domain-containing protein [Fodinicurvata sediminis]
MGEQGDQAWRNYEGSTALDLTARYEALQPELLHTGLSDLLPKTPGTILDVGAGSGRDAAWLAGLGHEVVAAEPSADMRAEAQRLHPEALIHWVDSYLPGLDAVYRLGLTFDFILLSAVWMHVPPNERQRALRKLLGLLRPGGTLALTLRHGPAEPERQMHPVSAEEINRLAKSHGAMVVHEESAPDGQGRSEITWTQMALRLPDDGTGALPLLRHVILNDLKTATYKLGLLRSVARAADSAQGMARSAGDEAVSVPLGLIALIWLRLYKPLLDNDLPQSPLNRASTQALGFAKQGYQAICHLSPLDLRPGATFTGATASALHQALKEASATIQQMPAHYMTWPDSDRPILVARRGRVGSAPQTLRLEESYLRQFGEIQVPLHLWRALARYDAWIEPALVNEWERLMFTYAERQERQLDRDTLAQALRWSDPERNVAYARRLAAPLLEQNRLYCVWSGKRLSARSLDIDHCLPWSAWPCEDLWNLMPSDRKVNQNQKREKLPAAERLAQASDTIIDWWQQAYIDSGEATSTRFFTEASSSLPVDDPGNDPGTVFSGLSAKRLALKADQQIKEW